jgi:hypothetical protein
LCYPIPEGLLTRTSRKILKKGIFLPQILLWETFNGKTVYSGRSPDRGKIWGSKGQHFKKTTFELIF